MSRGYTSRRIAHAVQAPTPVQTPDTDAATIYAQRWRRRDGKAVRAFSVLALDAQMAEEMGGIRIKERYNQDILDWTLIDSVARERSTALIVAILTDEDPDETQLREETFAGREEASGASV
jgi:hypothetical protein